MVCGKTSQSTIFQSPINYWVLPRPRGFKTFFMRNSAETEIKSFINTEIAQICVSFRFKSPKPVIYPAYKC